MAEAWSVDATVALKEHIFIFIFQLMEKPEDDSPLGAEGEVTLTLTRVPLASGFF